MQKLLRFLPDLKQPGNEWLTLVMMGVAAAAALVDLFSSVDFSSAEGLIAALLLVPGTLLARWKSYGLETGAADDREAIDV